MEKLSLVLLVLGIALISYGPVSEMLSSEPLGGCTCDGIEQMVAWAEGKEACVYKDSLGYKTIGIGFNMERSGARSVFSGCGADFDACYSGSKCLSDSQISCLFQYDLKWAKKGAANCIDSYSAHKTCVQNVLIDMTFNMGENSLCSWTNFKSQLRAKDYQAAASNMQSTKWCGQVGRRCTRNVNIVKSC